MEIEILDEYKQIHELVEKKAPLIFVTGGAGTGKSTMIQHLSDKYNGLVLKSAPTGIAALNISGKTIHSMFRLAPKFIESDDIQVIPQKFMGMYIKAKVIIIDEISMVTSNALDAVDMFLRKNLRSKLPFGGKTLILVGDLFQLPPIVANHLSELYYQVYDSAHFFSSKVMQQVQFEFIELKTVKRQNDEKFIEVLTNIRLGKNIQDTIDYLNCTCKISNEPEDGSMVLSPRNSEVDARNNIEYRKLRNVKEVSYDGVIEGNFKTDRLPSPMFLDLKIGTQVQFTQNNMENDVVNGTMGVVTNLFDNSVEVLIYSTNKKVIVSRAEWEEFDYKFNQYKQTIESVPCGYYRQIPLKLAWASTIHKCVDGDTLLETPSGLVKISDIKIGDLVNSGFRYKKVVNKWDSGLKKSFKLKTKYGYELICSEDHKILSYVAIL